MEKSTQELIEKYQKSVQEAQQLANKSSELADRLSLDLYKSLIAQKNLQKAYLEILGAIKILVNKDMLTKSGRHLLFEHLTESDKSLGDYRIQMAELQKRNKDILDQFNEAGKEDT